ncbi:MAG: copper amine oxidase N-terminal domain-containing protein [Caldisericia bacterium]
MKKIIFWLIILSLSPFLYSLNSYNYQLSYNIILQLNSEYMLINGVQKEIDPGRGTKPLLIKEWGRVILPIRSIIENLNGEIFWYQDERKVKIILDENIIELWIDKPQAKVNDETKWIDDNNHDVKPLIINGRTMLPIRFVAENLGLSVEWIDKEKKIILTYNKNFILNYKNEINLTFGLNEKGIYKLIIKNPLNEKVKINLSLNSINKPKIWFSEFCIKDICFFNEAEIDLKEKEKIELEIYFYIKDKGYGEFIFCLKYIDHMECIKFNIKGG